MKRAAILALLLVYVVGAVLAGGLHSVLADATDSGCGDSSTHLCSHVPPPPVHDEHTCPTCQSGILKAALASGPTVHLSLGRVSAAPSVDVRLPLPKVVRRTCADRAPPADLA